jgi:hypothetical protein
MAWLKILRFLSHFPTGTWLERFCFVLQGFMKVMSTGTDVVILYSKRAVTWNWARTRRCYSLDLK